MWHELVQKTPELAQQPRWGIAEHATWHCCANRREASGKGTGCKQPPPPKGHPHTHPDCFETDVSDVSDKSHVWRRGTCTEQLRLTGLGKIQPATDLTPALTLLAACSVFSQGAVCWGCWELKSSAWSKTEINSGLRNTTNPCLSLQHPSLFLISSDPLSHLCVDAVRSGRSFAPCCLDQCCQKLSWFWLG